MAHTKGPWTVLIGGWVGSYHIKESAANERKAMNADDDEKVRQITEADARLIAAAPDLLDVLKDAVSSYTLTPLLHARAEEVIAKATGAA